MDNTNFDRFLRKDEEIRKEKQLEGESIYEQELSVAHYFGMSLVGYRNTRSAALRARRAREAFEIKYYLGTHPDASVAESALVLGLTEAHAKAVLERK